MALTNKAVSLGQKDAVQHVINASSDSEIAPNEKSVRVKIIELKHKHERLMKSSSRPNGKRAHLHFYNKEFHVPLRDAAQPKRLLSYTFF